MTSIRFGAYTPDESSKTKDYFEKGRWTDQDDKPITKACVEDWVKFHIETQNILKGEKISFQVIDYDGILPNDKLSSNECGQKVTVDENGFAYIEWQLGEKTAALINSESRDYSIEYFVRCSYNGKSEDLADTSTTWLNVTLPPKKDKVRFVSASEEHVLPGIYDAETGDIYYISVEDIQSQITEYTDSEEKRALKNLTKINKLVKNLYGDRTYAFTIRRIAPATLLALHDGISKGIAKRLKKIKYMYNKMLTDAARKIMNDSSIDYTRTRSKGVVARKVGKFLKIGKFLLRKLYLVEIAALTLDAANGKKISLPLPSFMTAPLDQLDREVNQMLQEDFLDDMATCIFEGYNRNRGAKAMESFFFDRENRLKEEIRLGFSFIPMTEDGLNILLSGVIRELPITITTEDEKEMTIHDLRDLGYVGSSNATCGILVQRVYGGDRNGDKDHRDKYDRVIDIHNIFGIWTPPLIEEEA